MRFLTAVAAVGIGVGAWSGAAGAAGVVSPLPPNAEPVPSAPAPSTIYDAVQVSNLPPGTLYLAYIDGGYITWSAVHARFPKARILTVSTTGGHPADILDFEPGDVQSAATVRHWVASGMGHVVYSDRSDKALLDADLRGLSWQWYAADPTGCKAHVVPGSVATQYCWTGGYDISVTDGSWPEPNLVSAPAPSETVVSPIP